MIDPPREETSEALSPTGQGFYNGSRPALQADNIQKEGFTYVTVKEKSVGSGNGSALVAPGNG